MDKRRELVSGGELAFVDAGDPDAPPVVLLSGGFTSSHLWRHVVPLLSPWMRVLAPDLLGSGDSRASDVADLRLVGHARTIRELLRSLGIERFALAGHGHGGGVAQLIALEGGVEALALIDAVASDEWPAPGVRALRSSLDQGEGAAAETWLRAAFDSGMSHRERLSDDDLEEYLRPFRGEEGERRFVRVARSFDGEGLIGIEPRLGALEVPALVIWGEDDALLDAGIAERLGDVLPMAAVALLPGCGYFVLEDAPDTVAPLLFQWLRSRYLKVEHRHDPGPVTVQLGRPGEHGP